MGLLAECHCDDPTPLQVGAGYYCQRCGRKTICPAPPAPDDGKSSSSIGEQQPLGQKHMEGLILLLKSSEIQTRDTKALLKLLYEQSHQIKDLQQTTKFLAEQVKTLVDALAEDQDPDMPLTNYMSGKPI